MSRTPWPLLVLGAALALAACGKEQVRQEPTSAVLRETSTVTEGTVAALEENRIMLWDAQDPSGQPLAVDITDRTTLVKEGDYVDRGQLEEGGAVRVFFDETKSRPEALRVEILKGDEAKAIQERVEQATGGKR
jgi:hypothetical protein